MQSLSATNFSSSSSSLTGSVTNVPDEEKMPENWKWILNVVDEAHLPKLGLPVRWHKKTEHEHIKQVYDPTRKEFIDSETLTITKHKESPIGFITSTKDNNPMPGTTTPAAVRYDRYKDPELNERIITDAQGDELIPCLAHGDYVKVEALQGKLPPLSTIANIKGIDMPRRNSESSHSSSSSEAYLSLTNEQGEKIHPTVSEYQEAMQKASERVGSFIINRVKSRLKSKLMSKAEQDSQQKDPLSPK